MTTRTPEQFRDCDLYPDYSVSQYGTIRNDISGRYLVPYSNGKYLCVKLRKYNDLIKNVKVHRLVATAWLPNPDGKACIDHINNNRLDNRASNLRWATYSENNANKPKRQGDTSSRYKGVTHDVARGYYKVFISVNGRRFYLGAFDDEHDAGRAYNTRAIQEYGDFAHLNIIGAR
jgi:hypothetical protein